jgi:predicted TIM-barrel fold metal-dependent hydrolase
LCSVQRKRASHIQILEITHLSENVFRNEVHADHAVQQDLDLCRLATVGADHILFSADHPYAPLDRMTQFVETAPISEIDREKSGT